MSSIISVEKLSKAYRIGTKQEVPDTIVGVAKEILKAPFNNLSRLRGLDTSASSTLDASKSDSVEDILWALKDVSFEIGEGDVVGIIGRNGAGKSTLLKILSRITEPTYGKAVIKGRVSSLLEVGTGFHPELTGRENIYMNGTILGMTKKEIDRKFDEIVEFGGVEKFLDTPTKRYSSGMQVRLAFAVAAHLEPEILIIDEVLAVGDGEFQKKCLGKMQDIAGSGRTVLFVSHNIAAVARLCKTCIVISSGQASEMQSTQSALATYLGVGDMSVHSDLSDSQRDKSHDGPPIIKSVSIDIPNGIMKVCGPLQISVEVGNTIQFSSLHCAICITDAYENRVVMFHTKYHGGDELPSAKSFDLECIIDSLPLLPGCYNIDIIVGDRGVIVEKANNAIRFKVEFDDVFGSGYLPGSGQGVVALPCVWKEHLG